MLLVESLERAVGGAASVLDVLRVGGLNGLAFLRGERGLVRWRPARLWRAASRASRPLAHVAPSLAFHLLAVTDVAAEEPSANLHAAA